MRRVAAAAILLALAAGCAPARYRISGDEAAAAARFFAAAEGVPFPVRASFSGYAELRGGAVPLLAAVSSRAPADETVGVYDPLGGPILFLENDGRTLRFARGEAAGALPEIRLRPLSAGPLSIARVLGGAPGYPVSGGGLSRGRDGGWILSDGRQSLYSDPARRTLARAEYDIGGRSFVVTYPGRGGNPSPPATVAIEGMGSRIVLRRDAE